MVKNTTKSLNIFIFILYIITAISLYFVVDHFQQKAKNEYLENTTKVYSRAYNTIFQQYLDLSDVIYTGFTRLGDIPNQLAKLKNSDEIDKETIRSTIYNSIIHRYKTLNAKHIKSLNIILPDNTMFLKVKKPEHIGFKLSDKRKIIKAVIDSKKPLSSYEIGKNGAGFRFAYPLFKDKEFVGVLSVTFGAEAITSGIMKQYYVLSNFFIHQKYFNEDFLTKKRPFKVSHHEGFLFDLRVLKELKKFSRQDIKTLRPSTDSRKILRANFLKNKPISYYDPAIKSVFTTLPVIHTTSNEVQAVLTIRSKGDTLDEILNNYRIMFILLFGAISLLFFIIYIKKESLNKEHKLLQKSIEQKELFETIFNSSKDGISIIDFNGDIVQSNEAYSTMLGYSREELLTMKCTDICLFLNNENMDEQLELLKQKGYLTNIEKKCFHKNGNEIITNITISLLPDGEHILLIVKDMTTSKVLEEQSKLASMGEMIGNIAHQWRQPLSVISTASTGVMFRKELNQLTDTLLEEQMNLINDNAQYLSQTIDDFTNFIKDENTISTISIKESVEFALHLTKAPIKNNFITLYSTLDDDMKIDANNNEIVQSLINILNNAKDALVENQKEENRFLFVKLKSISDTELELSITDSAGGISDSIKDRIFEPYFTTKHQSKGTGLGLAMVHKILKEKYRFDLKVQNTTLTHENKEFTGASFSIVFKKS